MRMVLNKKDFCAIVFFEKVTHVFGPRQPPHITAPEKCPSCVWVVFVPCGLTFTRKDSRYD